MPLISKIKSPNKTKTDIDILYFSAMCTADRKELINQKKVAQPTISGIKVSVQDFRIA